jgi:hypothetical protein
MIFIPNHAVSRKLKLKPRRIVDNEIKQLDNYWRIGFSKCRIGQYYLCTHEQTLYSLIFPGRNVTIHIMALSIATLKMSSPEIDVVFYTNRSVLGSMNDMYRMINVTAEDAGRLDQYLVDLHVNRAPFSYIGMNRPRDLF